MRGKGFRFLEHTADVLVEVWAPKLEELFEEAARAMFEIITDTSKVDPSLCREVETEGFDLENSLYRWLEELLIIHDSENLVFGKFRVHKFEKLGEDRYVIRGEACGEPFNIDKHEPRTVVKAVTYAQMQIRKENSLWKATIVFDI
ncbi:MAG: archease [Thermoprotei archaeon]|nr:MAG: archease [Thermoprotei archaeon]